jgi:hypothetical protein
MGVQKLKCFDSYIPMEARELVGLFVNELSFMLNNKGEETIVMDNGKHLEFEFTQG